MLSTFAITLLASLASAHASATSEAAALISRYPQGAVPVNESVLAAIGTLGSEGSEPDLTLLTDMAVHELGAVQTAVHQAIDEITVRQRLAHRARHRGPSRPQIQAWLQERILVADDGRTLGRHERRVIAYASIALGHTLSPHRNDWLEFARSLENAGQTTAALQQYASAVLMGDFIALQELSGFGLEKETMVLGLFSSLPYEDQHKSPLYDWLKTHGTEDTVAVFSDRAMLGTALQRALALDSLSEMIRGGHLNRESTARARNRLERSTRDPHQDVRRLARTTLVELEH